MHQGQTSMPASASGARTPPPPLSSHAESQENDSQTGSRAWPLYVRIRGRAASTNCPNALEPRPYFRYWRRSRQHVCAHFPCICPTAFSGWVNSPLGLHTVHAAPMLSHNPTMAVTPGIPPAGNHCVQQTWQSGGPQVSKCGEAAAMCPAKRRSRHHVCVHILCICPPALMDRVAAP